jgi:hypothetical protein
VKATFIETRGDFLQAIIEVAGQQLVVMDDFEGSKVARGATIEVELRALVIDPGEWNAVFAANPDGIKGLRHLNGWSYLALGQIMSVNPVVCDCGLLTIEDAIRTRDVRCIGAHVGIHVDRLDAESL